MREIHIVEVRAYSQWDLATWPQRIFVLFGTPVILFWILYFFALVEGKLEPCKDYKKLWLCEIKTQESEAE